MSNRRLAFSFLVSTLAACSSSGLPLPDGGFPDGGAPDLGAGGRDAATADLAINRCGGLDHATCNATPGCVADTCLECSCTPRFAGCRSVDAPPVQCPAMGCPQPQCCHGAKDCAMGAFQCVSPGSGPSGGPCFMPKDCKVDGDCAAMGPDWICGKVTSSCFQSPMACTPGCASDMQCSEGEVCRKDHHCVGRACASAADCPAEFLCTQSECARRVCNVDGDCPGGYCVNGGCFTGLGMCEPPAA